MLELLTSAAAELLGAGALVLILTGGGIALFANREARKVECQILPYEHRQFGNPSLGHYIKVVNGASVTLYNPNVLIRTQTPNHTSYSSPPPFDVYDREITALGAGCSWYLKHIYSRHEFVSGVQLNFTLDSHRWQLLIKTEDFTPLLGYEPLRPKARLRCLTSRKSRLISALHTKCLRLINRNAKSANPVEIFRDA